MSEASNLHYVYILESLAEPDRHYTGLTDNLDERIKQHNRESVPHTSKFVPWRILVYTAFHDKGKAAAFERYLKSHSGRAFAKKH